MELLLKVDKPGDETARVCIQGLYAFYKTCTIQQWSHMRTWWRLCHKDLLQWGYSLCKVHNPWQKVNERINQDLNRLPEGLVKKWNLYVKQCCHIKWGWFPKWLRYQQDFEWWCDFWGREFSDVMEHSPVRYGTGMALLDAEYPQRSSTE